MDNDADTKWRHCLDSLGIPDARLLWQSIHGPGRRTYAHRDRIYKIRLLSLPARPDSPYGDLAREYAILKLCDGMRQVPRPVDYSIDEKVEFAVYEAIEASPLPTMGFGLLRSSVVLARAARVAMTLTKRGIAHNDLMPNNVMVAADMSVFLIDFDKATCLPPRSAFFRNFLKFRRPGFHGSMAGLIKEQLREIFPGWVTRFLRALFGRSAFWRRQR